MRAVLSSLIMFAHSLFGLPTSVPQVEVTPHTTVIPVVANEITDVSQVTPVPESGAVAVLMYHHLAYEANESGTLSPETFDTQIAELKAAGYRFITAAQFADYLDGKLALPGRSILLTFDDGYASNFELGLPILEKHQVPALIFPVMRYFETEGKGAWSPHLTWEQGEQLLASGLVTLGGHTYNGHFYVPTGENGQERGPWLTSYMWLAHEGRLETEREYVARIQADIALTRSLLRQLGQPGDLHFALPWGMGNETVLRELNQAGFRYVYTVNGGRLNRSNSDRSQIYRIDAGSPWVTSEWLIRRLETAFTAEQL